MPKTMPDPSTPAADLPAGSPPALVGLLAGNAFADPAAATKYGLMFQSLESVYGPMRLYDTSLRGMERLWTALLAFHPNRRVWQERFFKSPMAFAGRSRRASQIIRSLRDRVGLIFQLGALFDAGRDQPDAPVVIYTDYTARLSADDPGRFRSPFRGRQLQRQFENERQAYLHAAHVFTRSRLVERDIIDRYGIPPGKLSVVGGGVNLAQLPGPIPRTSEGGTGILFIGGDFERKGGDLLLRAFSTVRGEVPGACLRVLTNREIPPGLPLDGVELLHSAWSRELVARLYMGSDLFVLPARLETWGDVILEAGAFGLPCIGTRGQPMEEIIVEGETGLLVGRENVEELAAALRRLLTDADLRRRLGAAARERVLAEFTWDRVIRRMVPALNSTLAQRKAKAA